MTNILTELDSQLASLNQLKPPGASKTKIGSITHLCVSNIQNESSIVQSLYRALKKAPATHKLGALYVIDSVVRQWIEKAKQNGQDLNIEGRGEPGTFPAAIKRVTELMPALFEDSIKAIPPEQKPKLENMVNIWDKGSTFPTKLLAEFRTRLGGASAQSTAQTNGTSSVKKQIGAKFTAPIPSRPVHTPVGYPPQHLYDQGLIVRKGEQAQVNGRTQNARQATTPAQQPPPPAPTAPVSDVNSILAALASAVPQPVARPITQQAPPPAASAHNGVPQQLPPELMALFGQQNGPQSTFAPPPQPTPQAVPQFQMQGFQPPANYMGFLPQPPPSIPQQFAAVPPPPQPAAPADPLGPLRGILPPNILNDQGKLVMALNLLQDLQKQGLPMEQWGPVLKAFDESAPSTQPMNQGDGGLISQDRGREMSRSPERVGGRRGRASPVYGAYDDMTTRNSGGDDRNGRGDAGGRGRHRQRSPMPTGNVQIYDNPEVIAMNGMPMQPKWIAMDNSLPPNNIKVLSRTLFVGGANGTQAEIQKLFERFGRVQTCIANRDKRHAFVKMTTRAHALAAKAGMEELQGRNDRECMGIARMTKWGVGFGPRDCCDYQRGESIIPIPQLTDADHKWLLTAEYGGTGGRALAGGMVLEEPDIEIGAGVSSKAMSKRVMPDSGPPSKRQREREERERGAGGDGGGGGKRNKHGRHHNHHHHDHDGGYAAQAGGGYGGGGGGGSAAPPPPPAAAAQRMEAYGYARPEPVAVATPPAVPTFGFSLPGPPSYR